MYIYSFGRSYEIAKDNIFKLFITAYSFNSNLEILHKCIGSGPATLFFPLLSHIIPAIKGRVTQWSNTCFAFINKRLQGNQSTEVMLQYGMSSYTIQTASLEINPFNLIFWVLLDNLTDPCYARISYENQLLMLYVTYFHNRTKYNFWLILHFLFARTYRNGFYFIMMKEVIH